MSSSGSSQYSSSGCSYSEDSTEHFERSPDGALCGSLKKGLYMYNGRTFVVSIPGLLLVLAAGGETYVFLLCAALINFGRLETPSIAESGMCKLQSLQLLSIRDILVNS